MQKDGKNRACTACSSEVKLLWQEESLAFVYDKVIHYDSAKPGRYQELVTFLLEGGRRVLYCWLRMIETVCGIFIKLEKKFLPPLEWKNIILMP